MDLDGIRRSRAKVTKAVPHVHMDHRPGLR